MSTAPEEGSAPDADHQPVTDGRVEPLDSVGYAAAMTELEEILRTLDDDQLDIDRLGDLVERAALLISTCRARLDAARFRVSGLVDELAESTE